jgi:hypothetical protein
MRLVTKEEGDGGSEGQWAGIKEESRRRYGG